MRVYFKLMDEDEIIHGSTIWPEEQDASNAMERCFVLVEILKVEVINGSPYISIVILLLF